MNVFYSHLGMILYFFYPMSPSGIKCVLPLSAYWQWQCCHLCCIWLVPPLAPGSHTLCWCKMQELQPRLRILSASVPYKWVKTLHQKSIKHTSVCGHKYLATWSLLSRCLVIHTPSSAYWSTSLTLQARRSMQSNDCLSRQQPLYFNP